MQLTDFPTLLRGMEDSRGKRVDRFNAALKVLDDALAADGIMKGHLKEATYTINNGIDDAWKVVINDVHIYAGKYETLDEVAQKLHYALNSPQVHVIPGYLKKAEAAAKKTKHAYVTDIVAFLTEIMPIITTIDTLKGKIVARQPKKERDPYEKYRAPAASLGAIGKVKAALEEIFEVYRIALTKSYADYFGRNVEAYLKLNAELRAIDPATFKNESKEKKAAITQKFLMLANLGLNVHQFLTKDKSEREKWLGDYYTSNWTKADNIEDKIAKAAEKEATYARDRFVYKNLVKFDSIVDKKNNLSEIAIVSHDLSLNGLEGTLKVQFADGSSFLAKNQVVTSVSVLGNDFTRAPLNFMDVKLPNGQKMPRPSEKRMNELFVHA